MKQNVIDEFNCSYLEQLRRSYTPTKTRYIMTKYYFFNRKLTMRKRALSVSAFAFKSKSMGTRMEKNSID